MRLATAIKPREEGPVCNLAETVQPWTCLKMHRKEIPKDCGSPSALCKLYISLLFAEKSRRWSICPSRTSGTLMTIRHASSNLPKDLLQPCATASSRWLGRPKHAATSRWVRVRPCGVNNTTTRTGLAAWSSLHAESSLGGSGAISAAS
jgi:hypothetical protein